MFSLFSSPVTVGVHCADDCVHLVSGKNGAIIASAKRNLPRGIITNGTMTDAARFEDLLRRTFADLSPRPRAPVASLCLPSEIVYCQRISIPQGVAKDDAVRDALSTLLPEPWDTLAITTADVSKDTHSTVAVSAVRRDVLGAYVKACDAAGMRISRASSFSSLLGHAALPRVPAPALPFILVRAVDGHEPGAVTLFEGGHPTEETMLWTSGNIKEAVLAFVRAEEARGVHIASVLMVREAALIPELTKGLATTKAIAKSPAKKHEKLSRKADLHMPPTVVPAFPALAEDETEWLGATLASIRDAAEPPSFC